MRYQLLRGVHDILPNESFKWQFVEEKFREIFGSFGFSEIRTPIIEQRELFERSIGDQTDIVSKEMYSFVDKGGRNITLRPEATASVVRAAIEHNLLGKGKIVKLFYIGPMFRYERPQAGRFRQFHQAGVEFLGSSSYLADAEVIMASMDFLSSLQIRSLKLHINSVGCKKCRPKFEQNLKDFIHANLENLCDDCRERSKKNLLRVLDCKNKSCQKIYSDAPKILDFLCEDCLSHFEKLKKLLLSLGLDLIVDEKLVRGLDYYIKTTFEIVSMDLGSQNSLCGGGRYDNLVKDLGGSETPAVGMAIGLERLLSVIESQNTLSIETPLIDFYFAVLDEQSAEIAFSLVSKIRKLGKKIEVDYSDKSLSSKLKSADSIHAKNVLILGENERQKGICILRDMKSGDQKEIKISELLGEIKKC